MDRSAATDPDQRFASRQSRVVLYRDHRRGLYPAVHHAGGRGPDLRSDGANLCLRTGRSAAGDIHGDALSHVAAAPGACQRSRDHRRAQFAPGLHACAALVAEQQAGHHCDRIGLPRHQRLPRLAARQRVPADARGRQFVDSRVDAADPVARSGHADRERDTGNSAAPSRSHYGGLATWPSGQWQRCGGVLQCGVLRAAETIRRMAGRTHQGEAGRGTAGRIFRKIRRHQLQFLAIHPGQC